MKPASGKAKGRKCRRCKSFFDSLGTAKSICFECSLKCCKCNKTLTKENQDSRSYKLRKTYICKECVAKSIKNTPNRVLKQKEYDLRRKYSLTILELELLEKEQDYSCKICGEKAPLHVDHDHVTGLVRGLLCSKCNLGLGYFKDSVENLGKARDYLNAAKL